MVGWERGKEVEEFESKEIKVVKRGGILVGHNIKNSGGVYTPPPTWTVQPNLDVPNCYSGHNSNTHLVSKDHNLVTARQLGANLFYCNKSLVRMSKMGKLGSVLKNKGILEDLNDNVIDDQPVSTGTFHRQIAASVMRHHQSFDRNRFPVLPVSPASYGSSMEITPYNPAATPSSSVDYKGRLGDPSYNLKTSTELLKVLNRIWSLEEQHTSNVSLVRALKRDLDNARTRIKELLREKQMDKEIIDDLMKQVAEDKLAKKNMDQNRVQSLREELEDEGKLRKRSESMHRKMAREINDMKSSFSTALNELERERRARILLEDLCDEFAMGIRDYERELRSLQYQADKEHVHRDEVDSLVLHISEAWLDERVQMKTAEKQKDVGEKSMIVDKLRPEIETFLNARLNSDSRENIDMHAKNSKASGMRCHSSESFPLNEATSAPQNVEDEDDVNFIDSDSYCFELNKNFDRDRCNGIHPNVVHNAFERDQETLTKKKDLSSLQARFEKHMEKLIQSNGKSEIVEEGLLQRRSKRFGNHNLISTNSSSIEGERIHPVTDLPDDSHGQFLLTGPASPMKKWDSTIISQDAELVESSSRWAPKGAKANSLKAKLLEARLEGQNSLLKGARGS